MPGRNPSEAVAEYLKPLQQSLSCLSRCILRPSGYELDSLLTVTIPDTTAELLTNEGEILHLAFVQRFTIEPHFPFRYKIQTRAYYYTLEDQDHREILAYHWHPDTSSTQFPHFHLRKGAEYLRGVHFPTGRIAFEEFCQMLLDGGGVEPDREDARDVLAQNLAVFRKHKT